jgi:uncharacterized protein YdhG (YjbR/CyaY superfamily)
MAKLSAEVTEYIKNSPKESQPYLRKMRVTVRKAAPKAEEVIGYGIPTYKMDGNLVHFGGFKNHIGFFPSPAGIAAFKKELTKYKLSKGTIQFPLDAALPVALVIRIVKFRIKEQLQKQKANAKKK